MILCIVYPNDIVSTGMCVFLPYSCYFIDDGKPVKVTCWWSISIDGNAIAFKLIIETPYYTIRAMMIMMICIILFREAFYWLPYFTGWKDNPSMIIQRSDKWRGWREVKYTGLPNYQLCHTIILCSGWPLFNLCGIGILLFFRVCCVTTVTCEERRHLWRYIYCYSTC